ncbi:helix-turn-helix domain-containing protein [Selenomonas ruminantium]|uniref:helix-turn-helix transcriptional regulator n=1 Tax=Selenomonas ruminantium TaxID=971 RepID=UPI00047AA121
MKDTKSQQLRFISVKALAAMVPVSRSLIYDRIAKNKIPCLRIGRRILIPVSYVQKMLNVM